MSHDEIRPTSPANLNGYCIKLGGQFRENHFKVASEKRPKERIVVTWAAPHFSFYPCRLQFNFPLLSSTTEANKVLHETHLQTLNYSTSQTVFRQFSWLNATLLVQARVSFLNEETKNIICIMINKITKLPGTKAQTYLPNS